MLRNGIIEPSERPGNDYDRGKVVVSELSKAVNKLLPINHRTTSSYNPQASGLVERMNHVFIDMLSMYVNGAIFPPVAVSMEVVGEVR